MVLFSDLVHLALTASPGISSHGTANSRSALAGYDARALPAFASDIVQLHHTVKRARSIVEERDAVHVPRPELLDIIEKLKSLQEQVTSLLPAGAKHDNKADHDDQNCDAEHLLYSLGLNDTHSKRDQVSYHHFYTRNANCSMEAIAAAQKQDISIGAAVKSPGNGHSSSSPTAPSPPGVGDPATGASGDSSDSQVTESAAVGVPSLGAGHDGASAKEKAPDVDDEHKTTTITMTVTSRTTITVSRKHTETRPPDAATDIPTGMEVHGSNNLATATDLPMETKSQDIDRTQTAGPSKEPKVEEIDKETSSELPTETKGKDDDETANTELPKETKVQGTNEASATGLPTETKSQDNDKTAKTDKPTETAGQDTDHAATNQVAIGTKSPDNDPAATTERPSETTAPGSEQTTSTGTQDEHEAVATSVGLPESESAQASSLSVSAPVSAEDAEDEKTVSQSAMQSMTADNEDEPSASITFAVIPPLVSSEGTPALTSDTPTQTSSAGAAERLLAAHATPSGFVTVTTQAAKGDAETTQ